MKPFNLERALTGDPVVTREGISVTELHIFNTLPINPLVAIIEGQIRSFRLDGYYDGPNARRKYDLFMKSTKHEGWVNLYHNINKSIYFISAVYDTEKEAKENIESDCINTIQIEWEG